MTAHPSALDARGFFTQVNTAPEHPGASSALKITWRRTVLSPLTKNLNAVSARGEHPANYLDCPKNPRHRIAEKEKKKLQKKPVYITPEPPKSELLGAARKTAAQRQQSTSTNQQKQEKPPTASTSQPKQNNNRKPSPIYSTSSSE
ncbi:hypothetical protein TNCV_2503851 [Trichonephila clavipes]|nr:hypothetical protein TNCV_2503851 [Trichonephila clavipes]